MTNVNTRVVRILPNNSRRPKPPVKARGFSDDNYVEVIESGDNGGSSSSDEAKSVTFTPASDALTNYVGAERMIPQKMGPISFDEDAKLWYQQREEPDRAYLAFSIYLELGPNDRSNVATYRVYSLKPEGKSVSAAFISSWRRKYRWDERVRSYDDEVSTRLRKELQERRLASRLETALLLSLIHI